jgi:hypothetical protein
MPTPQNTTERYICLCGGLIDWKMIRMSFVVFRSIPWQSSRNTISVSKSAGKRDKTLGKLLPEVLIVDREWKTVFWDALCASTVTPVSLKFGLNLACWAFWPHPSVMLVSSNCLYTSPFCSLTYPSWICSYFLLILFEIWRWLVFGRGSRKHRGAKYRFKSTTSTTFTCSNLATMFIL